MKQQFKVYSDTVPINVAAAIQSDLAANLPATFIKQMGVVQLGSTVAAWVLWETGEVA